MKKDRKIIVITAGGTIESIDSVRSIINTSTGKLGATIAEQMKKELDADIFYVSNRNVIRPNVEHTWIETTSVLDVKEKLQDLLSKVKVDIFIHSMAVADYYVEKVESGEEVVEAKDLMVKKLSSEHEHINIQMKKAPKLISLIKQWQPRTYLVGFKLLNDVEESELFTVGFNLLRKNRCNLVIANDLDSIQKGNHEALFILPEKKYEKISGKGEIAIHLANLIKNKID